MLTLKLICLVAGTVGMYCSCRYVNWPSRTTFAAYVVAMLFLASVAITELLK